MSHAYDFSLALLRVVTGFIVWQHGAQSLFGMLSGTAVLPWTLPWLAGGLEFFGGISLAGGVLTRPIAILLALDMAVLYITTYLPLGFPPIVTRPGEVACLLLNANLLLAFTGAGRWSGATAIARVRPALGTKKTRGDARLCDALGAVRIFMGLLFVSYGLRKMFGMFGEAPEPFLTLQWFAGIVELFGGTAIVLGIFTRWTAFVCSGQMAFAYFINHNPRGFFPIENGGERAALFCFFFLFLWTAGPGRWSLDRLRASAR